MSETSKQVTPPQKRNPTGKGGFGENPQNRNDGHWKAENTISFQYKRFLSMTFTEFKKFGELPDSEKTVAMIVAYAQVLKSRSSLPHAREVTDRTDGKPKQSVDVTSDGNELKVALVEFIGDEQQNQG